MTWTYVTAIDIDRPPGVIAWYGKQTHICNCLRGEIDFLRGSQPSSRLESFVMPRRSSRHIAVQSEHERVLEWRVVGHFFIIDSLPSPTLVIRAEQSATELGLNNQHHC